MQRDEAEAALEAARTPGSLVQRLRASPSFPKALETLLVEAADTRGGYWSRGIFEGAEDGIAEQLATIDDAALARLQRTLLPQLQPAVAAAWRALAHRPYTRGEARRPFRCPGDAKTLARRRGVWLLDVANLLGDYDRDAAWVAEWAPHLTRYATASEVGWLLAGALDCGGDTGDAVFAVLQASMAGGHPVAAMGRHVTQALMACARPDAWEANEKLLLAAQRQEGLRQVVLEAIDEAHPEAFRRMLRLVVDEDLARFAAVVRAFDVWFGFQWATGSDRKIREVLTTVLGLFDDDAARDAALAAADGERAYLALWTMAFHDVERAIPAAVRMLTDERTEKRLVAAHLLVQTQWMPARKDLLPALDDADLRVAARALDAYRTETAPWVRATDAFPALERLIARLSPKTQKLQPLVWPWWTLELGRADVAQAMVHNREGIALDRVLPHANALAAEHREGFVRDLAGLGPRWGCGTHPSPRPADLGAHGREFLIAMLGDAATGVRLAAFQALAKEPLHADETARLVDLLARKAGDLRTQVLTRLRALADAELLTTAATLLADGDELRRLGGLELLRDAVEHDRVPAEARSHARAFAASAAPQTAAMQAHLDAILGGDEKPCGFHDAFGLVDPAALPRWPAPRALNALDETAAARCIESLAALLREHAATEVRIGDGEPRRLLDLTWSMLAALRATKSAENEANLPLRDVWRAWAATVDPNDLLQACVCPDKGPAWSGPHAKALLHASNWGARRMALAVLEWGVFWRRPAATGARALDALETALAAITRDDALQIAAHAGKTTWMEKQRQPWESRQSRYTDVLARVRELREVMPDAFLPADAARLYALTRFARRNHGGADQQGIRLAEFCAAVASGGLGDLAAAELTDLLVGAFAGVTRCHLLAEASKRTPPAMLAAHPPLVVAVDRVRRRIVEVECQRGDRKSEASIAAIQLAWPGGLEVLQQALPALGAAKFARHMVYSWSDQVGRQDALSLLIARSAPRPEDTTDAFAAWAKRAKVKPNRLVELAAYAPQWVAHVAAVLGWPGLQSAVWWIQAHTKDDGWNQRELRDEWAARISEYTPLAAQDLTEGAVDVAWFHAAIGELGAERWATVYAAAKYASSSGGHKRAQRFADAMTGAVTRDEILAEIDDKRQQDAVRALGLLPLAAGDGREADLLLRYRRLHEFRRESRQFGSQRQASEGRAAALGLENLARTAGFRDPLRLQWAMERAAVEDLTRGPVTVVQGDVTVQLALDGDGAPELTVSRKGKALAAVPAALRKDAEIAALRDRDKELRRQRSRIRGALEDAMCRGDSFTGAELQELLRNPMLAPSLERLVFVGEGIAGYPTAGGRALVSHDGTVEPVRAQETLRIAHPHDLFGRGNWPAWQRECLVRERVQPFKQVFRELYPLTADERTDGTHARRYAGHQVNPRQALALLGGRGWVTRPEEGVSRTFHAEGFVARLGFQEGFYTPADVDGLTLESVVFTKRDDWKAVPLATVPPRVFSECMRDLDLVVAVAHRGGVDPEATASTVAMRAALLRETCTLLGLANVDVGERSAVVKGTLGEYSLHLGSAQVRLLGGPAVCIVAVPSQHRGRLFLPFADDDPRTAEVLAKALLLARDGEIRDPNILDQLRGPR